MTIVPRQNFRQPAHHLRLCSAWYGLGRAHCGSGCHVTFDDPELFDRHRSGGQCLHPHQFGLSRGGGVWRYTHELQLTLQPCSVTPETYITEEAVTFAATLWIIGIVLLAAAVVGQTLKIMGNEVPALTSGAARIALGVIGLVALILGGVVHFDGPTTGPVPPALARATIDRPAEGSGFRVDEVFTVSGDVNGLPQGGSLWLLVASAENPNRTFYFSTAGPVAIRDGTWSDAESYEATAVGRKQYVLVQAGTACAQQLSVAANSASSVVEFLDDDCRELDRVSVEIV